MANFKVSKPRGHGDCDFAPKTCVRWSKNVLEEQQCPPQPLVGSADPSFCVLINFAVHLKEHLGIFPSASHLFTDSTSESAVKNLIATHRKRLEKLTWKNKAFVQLATEDNEEGVGTHSHRKFPSDCARGCGAAPDETEIQGRWKSQGQRVVFRHIDVKQLAINAKVAGILCVGGPAKHKLKNDVSLTDDWLFEHVAPNVCPRFPNDSRLCRALGTACSPLFNNGQRDQRNSDATSSP